MAVRAHAVGGTRGHIMRGVGNDARVYTPARYSMHHGYFSRTVGAGDVCVVIVLRLERYMAHCECQQYAQLRPTDSEVTSHDSHVTLKHVPDVPQA